MADASASGAPVAIIMGSRSDWPTMQAAAAVLDELGVGYEKKVVSAHRTPERMYAFARSAAANGFKVIIAGAGGAAHLPGMTASMTILPVLGVPIRTRALDGIDSLLSNSADAGGRSGRGARDRRGGRPQRWPAGRADPRPEQPGLGRPPRDVPHPPDRIRG